MELHNLIINTADSGLELQSNKGSLPGGRNGPWQDYETPVRNTAHWLRTFAKAHEITSETRYYIGVENAVSYICSEEARPYGSTYFSRVSNDRDLVNGLIGQVRVLDGLLAAIETLDAPDQYISLAEELFLLHPFVESVGLWKTVDIEGNEGYLHRTFNQQLWFAAIGSHLQEFGSSEVSNRVDRFLDRLQQNIALYPEGLIHHAPIVPDPVYKPLKPSILYHNLRTYFRFDAHLKGNRDTAVAYHAFNLYGFALLKQRRPDHSFWESDSFEKIRNYSILAQFEEEIHNNSVANEYHPTNIELAFFSEVFDATGKEQRATLVTEQIEQNFDFDSNLLNKNTQYPQILSARFCEATRLQNYKIIN